MLEISCFVVKGSGTWSLALRVLVTDSHDHRAHGIEGWIFG